MICILWTIEPDKYYNIMYNGIPTILGMLKLLQITCT